MAWKLTKEETARRDEVTNAAGAARDALNAALDAYNERVAAAFAELKTAADAYNETCSSVRDFAEAVATRLRDDFDAKSERWQQSEKGQTVEAFVSAWEDFAAEDFEPEEPLEVEGPDEELAEQLNKLPEEAD